MSIHILALGASTIYRAQQSIASCEACSTFAELPFDWILDEVTGCDGTTTDYFLTEPVECPRCGGKVVEKTLVEAGSGVFAL
jgi:hypothetical protein